MIHYEHFKIKLFKLYNIKKKTKFEMTLAILTVFHDHVQYITMNGESFTRAG